jgi:uncharacterized protein involved in type VI secretion and phage assembly
LHTKLQRTAKALKKWAQSKIGNCKLLLIAAKQLIWIFDVAQEYRLLSNRELQFHRKLKQRFLGLTAVEKLRARQCSRLTMIKATNTNSKLFFMRSNAQRRKNFIKSLQVSGATVYTQHDKEQAAYSHFSSLFDKPGPRSHTLRLTALGTR